LPSGTLYTIAGKDAGGGNTNKWIFGYANSYGGVSNATFFHINNTSGGGVFLRSNAWTPTIGVWYHLAVVKSGNSYTFYRDGVADGTATTTVAVPDSSGTLQVGRAEGAFYWRGQIDDLRLWNVARSATEIAGNRNTARTGGETGLTSYWKFDEGGTSLAAADATANHNDGALGGANATRVPTWATAAGSMSYAGLSFDGVDDYVNVPDAPSLRVTSTLTIEFWGKRQRFGTDIVLEKGGDWTQGDTDYGAGLHSINNNMFYFYFDGGWRGTSGVSDLNWHHYAIVAQEGDVSPRLYVDGQEEPVLYSGGAGTIHLNASTSALHIGAQLGAYSYYRGDILSEVRIWNVVRSASEIQADMDMTLVGSESGLVGYWKFDEGTGLIAAECDCQPQRRRAGWGGGRMHADVDERQGTRVPRRTGL